MIGTIRISQLPSADTITGNETVIVNQSGNTRRTTANDIVGILTYVDSSGISTVSENLTGSPDIAVSSLTVSGISTLGNLKISSGIVTAVSGIVTYYGDGGQLENVISGVGIKSTGSIVGTGITTINFLGVGNTFTVDGSTVNISIRGTAGIAETVGIGTTVYTIQDTDRSRLLQFIASDPISITVPSGLSDGFDCLVIQMGTGEITLSTGVGVTINSGNNARKTAYQYAAASLLWLGVDSYLLTGEIVP